MTITLILQCNHVCNVIAMAISDNLTVKQIYKLQFKWSCPDIAYIQRVLKVTLTLVPHLM